MSAPGTSEDLQGHADQRAQVKRKSMRVIEHTSTYRHRTQAHKTQPPNPQKHAQKNSLKLLLGVALHCKTTKTPNKYQATTKQTRKRYRLVSLFSLARWYTCRARSLHTRLRVPARSRMSAYLPRTAAPHA